MDNRDGLDAVYGMVGAGRRPGTPCLIGITGAVASGKSTFADALRARFEADGATVEVVSTDGFLFPNAVLTERGLLARKGYPETYDVEALLAALARARTGPIAIPAYSHVTYDVDPATGRTVDRPDVLIVEGLGLGAEGLPLDTLIYLDADEAHLEEWFVDRFLGLWRAAETDTTSFYARFRAMTEDQTRELARTVWRQVNLPNLRDHISLARDRAHIVVRKGTGHHIAGVERRFRA